MGRVCALLLAPTSSAPAVVGAPARGRQWWVAGCAPRRRLSVEMGRFLGANIGVERRLGLGSLTSSRSRSRSRSPFRRATPKKWPATSGRDARTKATFANMVEGLATAAECSVASQSERASDSDEAAAAAAARPINLVGCSLHSTTSLRPKNSARSRIELFGAKLRMAIERPAAVSWRLAANTRRDQTRRASSRVGSQVDRRRLLLGVALGARPLISRPRVALADKLGRRSTSINWRLARNRARPSQA